MPKFYMYLGMEDRQFSLLYKHRSAENPLQPLENTPLARPNAILLALDPHQLTKKEASVLHEVIYEDDYISAHNFAGLEQRLQYAALRLNLWQARGEGGYARKRFYVLHPDAFLDSKALSPMDESIARKLADSGEQNSYSSYDELDKLTDLSEWSGRDISNLTDRLAKANLADYNLGQLAALISTLSYLGEEGDAIRCQLFGTVPVSTVVAVPEEVVDVKVKSAPLKKIVRTPPFSPSFPFVRTLFAEIPAAYLEEFMGDPAIERNLTVVPELTGAFPSSVVIRLRVKKDGSEGALLKAFNEFYQRRFRAGAYDFKTRPENSDLNRLNRDLHSTCGNKGNTILLVRSPLTWASADQVKKIMPVVGSVKGMHMGLVEISKPTGQFQDVMNAYFNSLESLSRKNIFAAGGTAALMSIDAFYRLGFLETELAERYRLSLPVPEQEELALYKKELAQFRQSRATKVRAKKPAALHRNILTGKTFAGLLKMRGTLASEVKFSGVRFKTGRA